MNKYQSAFEKYNTDKHHFHQYDEVYNNTIGDEEINSVLEIGVLEGNSLRAWKYIWPNATVEGVDVNIDYIEKLKNEFIVHCGNSADQMPSSINRTYDVIIDDGHHHWNYQYNTLINFYNLAEKFYVIEDVTGNYSVNKLKSVIPYTIWKQGTIFDSKKSCRKFIHTNNVETNTSFKIIVFDKR